MSPAGAASAVRAKRVPLAAAFALLSLGFSLVSLFCWDAFRHASVLGLFPLFERHDVHVYFLSSAWVEGQGTLYREVASEYLLPANLIFGAVRYLSRFVPVLADPFDRFAWTWITVTLPLYLFVLYRLITRYPRPAPLLWLTPAALHFSLYRFDVYTVIVFLLAIESIHANSLRRAALLLGLVTALKAYALFLIPAYTIYVAARRPVRETIEVLVLQIAPFVLANLAVMAFAGREGMLAPFRFQAIRGLNGESGYDGIAYLTGPALPALIAKARWIPPLLQAAAALAAAALRPRTFDDLLRAFLFAIAGFVSFSVFYSPQFVLWLVPLVAWWTWPRLSIAVVALSWVTYVYFPIVYFRRERHPGVFRALIVTVTALRFALMAMAALPQRRPNAETTA